MRGKRRHKELNVPKTPIGEKIRSLALAYKGAHADGMLQAADVLEAEIKRAGVEAALLYPMQGKPQPATPFAADSFAGRIERAVLRLEELVADALAVVHDAPRAPRPIPPILEDPPPALNGHKPHVVVRGVSSHAGDALLEASLEQEQKRKWREQQPGPIEDLDEGGRGERELLAAIIAANFAGHDEASQRWLCVLTGYKPRTCSTYVSRLRAKGYVNVGEVSATEAGIKWLGDYARPPRGAALVDWWRRKLGGGGERELFDRLVKVYPNALSHADLLDGSSMKARTVSTYLSRLARRRIIAKSGRAYRAADELGLRAS